MIVLNSYVIDVFDDSFKASNQNFIMHFTMVVIATGVSVTEFAITMVMLIVLT